ncbi:CPBP family glutamic-type intramembrane protease [Planotetraspora sp. A-T 1434]|uniref:CPBP family intramembrane glutamic endopeptidase n=1 Tax=Planotetraspora sp. A-T 1434 TaxID=2979219 RepID=UPI0021BE0F9A|nr:CPBP family glutamic-type intramembrane protease [Planotetraspora sp. A-T 1434]MCT9932590.1 CPBP family glutamic-type intramembrane protease [Planotetraspora sp. A-T 1434]
MSEPQPDRAWPHPQAPERHPAQPHHPAEPQPGLPYAAGEPYPGQPQPGHPYGAQPQQGRLYPGEPQHGGPYPAQSPHPWAAYPGGSYPGAAHPWQAPARLPWAVPPPPGTRYDRLARTAAHRWWRPIVGSLAIVAGFIVVSLAMVLAASVLSVIVHLSLARDGTRFFTDPLLDLGFQLGLLALAIPLVYGAAWVIQRRPPGTLSSVAFRLRWGWLATCVLVALVAVALAQVAETVTLVLTGADPGYGWAGWDRFLPAIVVILLLVPFQAAAEEYIFRGWILQAFGAYLKNPWPGILLGSAAFAALHGYTDWGIGYVFGFGVLMGWLAVRTGGLEAPIALHVTNNVVAFGLTAASGDLGSALQQGALPWQSIAGTVVQFAVYGFAVVIIARKRAIQAVSR